MKKRLLVWLVAVLAACSTELSRPGATPQEPAGAPPPGPGSGGSGRLIFTRRTDGVWEFDLATGDLRPLFQPSPAGEAWVTAAAVAPDGRTIVLAYAPPPPAGQIQWGYTELYVMPADGSTAPLPFLTRRATAESFFNPSWSADGRFIYYAHLQQTPAADPASGALNYQYLVERAAFPAGAREVVVENAYWPRPSRDGARLAYVALAADFVTNSLWVAGAEGDRAQPVGGLAGFTIVDAPLFTPDGAALLFSAPSPAPASARLFWVWWGGVRAARAHNAASDWWRVALADGQAEQLTRIAEAGLYGDFSPDGQRLAFVTAKALMLMDADGRNLTRLMESPGLGTVSWVAPAP